MPPLAQGDLRFIYDGSENPAVSRTFPGTGLATWRGRLGRLIAEALPILLLIQASLGFPAPRSPCCCQCKQSLDEPQGAEGRATETGAG